MPDADTREPVSSRHFESISFAIPIASLVAIALLAFIVLFNPFGSESGQYVGYAGAAGLVLAGIVIIFRSALSFSQGDRPRTLWLFIGAGVSFSVLGIVVTLSSGAHTGHAPELGLQHVFYAMQYACLSTGMVMAATAYRGMLDLRRSLIVSAISSLVLAIVVTATLTYPIVWGSQSETIAPGLRTLAVIMPMADILFMFAPAVFVVATVRQLGKARFAWPWYPVVTGSLISALMEIAYFYQQGFAGDLDMGFVFVGAGRIAAIMLFAWGSSIERHVFNV